MIQPIKNAPMKKEERVRAPVIPRLTLRCAAA